MVFRCLNLDEIFSWDNLAFSLSQNVQKRFWKRLTNKNFMTKTFLNVQKSHEREVNIFPQTLIILSQNHNKMTQKTYPRQNLNDQDFFFSKITHFFDNVLSPLSKCLFKIHFGHFNFIC